jgi:hypothetical protein
MQLNNKVNCFKDKSALQLCILDTYELKYLLFLLLLKPFTLTKLCFFDTHVFKWLQFF